MTYSIRKIFYLVAIVLVAAVAGPTPADSKENPNSQGHSQLKGDYAVTLIRTCATGNLNLVPDGGDAFLPGPTARRVIEGGFIQQTLFGVFSFSPDGTGSLAARRLAIYLDATEANSVVARQHDINCDVAYEGPGGDLAFELLGCLQSSGGGAGNDIGPIMLQGAISVDGGTIVLGDVEPDLVTIQNSSGVGLWAQRLCSQSGTAVRTSPAQGGKH